MSQKRLKFLLIACIACSITLLLWACQTLPPQTLPSQIASSSDRLVVKLSGWGSSPAEQHVFQQVLEGFRSQYPNVDLQFEVISDQYMDVMKTRLIGDAAPDVFYLEATEAPFLIQNNVLEPLDSYITPAFDLDDFEANLLAPFKAEGRIYGLPKDFSTLALFYDREAFAAVGLDTPPKTWDELLAYAELLTVDENQDGTPDRYGLGILPDLARLVYIIEAFGGQVVDAEGYAAFASDAGLKGLELLVNQYRNDRTSARPTDVGTNSGIEMLGQGKSVMAIEGSWAIPYLAETYPDLNYATAEVPKINDRPGTMAYPVAYVMNRQSQHKQEAWQLISYLTGKEGMTKWTSSGAALPTRKSVVEDLEYDRDLRRSALLAGASYATVWQLGSYPAAIMNNFNNQFISVLLGQQPLKPAMEKAQAEANEQIRSAI